MNYQIHATCIICYQAFTYDKNMHTERIRKYCSDKCRAEGMNELRRIRRREEQKRYKPKETLEKHLRELGIRAEDYASYQKAQTLRMCGRVLV